MKRHGPLASKIALWFTILSPLMGLIFAFVGAWLSNQLGR